MRITAVETFMVPPRWMFVKISTDAGIDGWGEGSLEGYSDVISAATAALAEQLVGGDPLRIEDFWQRLAKGGFYRGGPVLSSALAGIDQALWDIAGKTYGVPVYQLLGGHVRDRVRVYGWVGGDSPAEVAEAAQVHCDAGLTAIKMNGSAQLPHLPNAADAAQIVDRARLVRDVLGDHRDFAIDFHGRVSGAAARRLLPLLEPLHPLFVEEPVLPGNNYTNLARLIASSSTPIATGERLYSRWDVLPVLQAGVAVLQPDVAHAGGISEVRRIAALAETYDVAIAPHCPLGPLALASCLQLDFAIPNFLIQEHSAGLHYNSDSSDLTRYVSNPEVLEIRDGYIERQSGVGLGVLIDEAAVRESAAQPVMWRPPIWTKEDGSFAEW